MADTARRTSQAHVSRPRVEGDREAEILDAALLILATHGYDRLTMDAVAASAKASKATLYRRWNSKCELVIDALVRAKQAPHVDVVDTGTLRDDLMAMACNKGGINDSQSLDVLASIITALRHDEEFADAFHEQYVLPKVAASRCIYERAKARGEIAQEVDIDLLAPVLASIILHRAFVLRLPIDDDTVARIIDEIVIPAATRKPEPTRRQGK